VHRTASTCEQGGTDLKNKKPAKRRPSGPMLAILRPGSQAARFILP
jgi:hypothetical protein